VRMHALCAHHHEDRLTPSVQRRFTRALCTGNSRRLGLQVGGGGGDSDGVAVAVAVGAGVQVMNLRQGTSATAVASLDTGFATARR
jgi:hypothetical protein